MQYTARSKLTLPVRRHVALAAGLVALWLQMAAFAAPMPGMAESSSVDSILAAAHCLDAGMAADASAGKPVPAGKSTTPCPQCPLCQTLQVVGFTPPPPATVLAEFTLSTAARTWPANDHRPATQSAATGFLSRAPPAA